MIFCYGTDLSINTHSLYRNLVFLQENLNGVGRLGAVFYPMVNASVVKCGFFCMRIIPSQIFHLAAVELTALFAHHKPIHCLVLLPDALELDHEHNDSMVLDARIQVNPVLYLLQRFFCRVHFGILF